MFTGTHEQNDAVLRHRSAHVDDVLALLELVDIRKQVGQRDLSRPIDDQAECTLSVVLEQQHDALGEIRIRELAARDEEHAPRETVGGRAGVRCHLHALVRGERGLG